MEITDCISDEKIRNIHRVISNNYYLDSNNYLKDFSITRIEYSYLSYDEENMCCNFFCTLEIISQSSKYTTEYLISTIDLCGDFKLKLVKKGESDTLQLHVPEYSLIGMVDGKYISKECIPHLSEIMDIILIMGYFPKNLPEGFKKYINKVKKYYDCI